MLELLPVIENGGAADWAPTSDAGRWIALSGDTSDQDIARVVASIAAYSRKIGIRETLAETTTAIADTPAFVVGGGLMFRLGDFEAAPGCCCGLEGWREWEAVGRNGQSPWLGHDPMAWIDCTGERAVFWDDEDGRSVDVGYDEIAAALVIAGANLTAFVARLRAWSAQHGCDPRLADHFKRIFYV